MYNLVTPLAGVISFYPHIKSLDIVKKLYEKLDASSEGITEYAFTIKKTLTVLSDTLHLMFREFIRQWIINDINRKRSKT